MHLAILSGILIGTSYIPFPPWALLFCFVPLWLNWFRNSTPKRVFWTGWVTQFVLSMIGFHWIIHTVVEFGHMHWSVGFLVLLLFSATQSLHIPIAGYVWAKLNERSKFSPLLSILFIATMTALLENYFPKVFPWNLGYPLLWAKIPAFQWGDVIGFEGLSHLNFLANGAILLMIWHRNSERKLVFRYGVILIAAVAFFNLTGLWKEQVWKDADSKLRVTAVQANIGNFDKFLAQGQDEFRPAIYKTYFGMTRDFLAKLEHRTDLVIWPETAFPANLEPFVLDGTHQTQFRNFVREIRTPILTGAYSESESDENYYNALFLFDENANFKGTYRKTHLLAFGEYFPGAQYLPFLNDIIPEISSFSAGDGPTILQTNGLRMGGQICYEGLYPAFSRGLAKKGAQIVFNVTNDSWFGHTFEPYQHLYMTLARAVEIRRPLLRATNTGITSAVLADGTVLEQSPQEEKWAWEFNIPYRTNPELTIFTRIGHLIPWIQGCFLFILALLVFRRGKSQRT